MHISQNILNKQNNEFNFEGRFTLAKNNSGSSWKLITHKLKDNKFTQIFKEEKPNLRFLNKIAKFSEKETIKPAIPSLNFNKESEKLEEEEHLILEDMWEEDQKK